MPLVKRNFYCRNPFFPPSSFYRHKKWSPTPLSCSKGSTLIYTRFAPREIGFPLSQRYIPRETYTLSLPRANCDDDFFIFQLLYLYLHILLEAELRSKICYFARERMSRCAANKTSRSDLAVPPIYVYIYMCVYSIYTHWWSERERESERNTGRAYTYISRGRIRGDVNCPAI